MRWSRKLSPIALVAALLMLIPGAQAAWAEPTTRVPSAPDDAGVAGQAGPGFRIVTLITGDRISVSTDGQHTVAPVPGEKLTTKLVRREVNGHHLVIPVGALDLIEAGKLDMRLFDLNELMSMGYDDRRADLPLLIAYPEDRRASLRSSAALTNVAVGRELPGVHMVAVRQHRTTAVAAWKSLTTESHGRRTLQAGVDKIWLDGQAKVSLDVSVPQIGAPAAWAAGDKGDGVTVGIVDSGVDDTHADLAGRVLDRVDFTAEADNLDHVGHGTHVASIIGGTGAASGGKYTGVAPEVRFIVAKACVGDGTCAESAVIAGMQWVAEKGVKVANLSLGDYNYDGLDPLEDALQTLTDTYGTLFVVAAGNDSGWVSSPASAPSALAVGAVDKSDVPASFSNRGIVLSELAAKPEIAAPGVDITAARGKDSPGDGAYIAHSGTSMATPHVTGTAALLLSEHPDLTWQQLKDTIVSTAKGSDANWLAEGAGRVDAGRAVTQAAYSSPATITFGDQLWPHDKPTAAQSITYHNAGTTPLSLNLTVEQHSASGQPVPDGLFTASPATITVPAGADATVQVVANPQLNPPDYTFLGGTVNAAGDGVTLRTPLMMATEPQLFDLTVAAIDRTGAATDSRVMNTYWPMDNDDQSQSLRAEALTVAAQQPVHALSAPGVRVYRLPPGDYNLDQIQWTAGGDDADYMLMVTPRVVLDRDVSITMDARLAEPMSATPPRPDATLQYVSVGYQYKHPMGWAIGDVLDGMDFDHLYTAQIGPSDPLGLFYGDAQVVYLKQSAGGTSYDSPFYYHLAWYAPVGSFFTGFAKTFDPKKFGRARVHYAAPFSGATLAVFTKFRRPFDHAHWLDAVSVIDTAMTRDEYYDLENGDLIYEKRVDDWKVHEDNTGTEYAERHEPAIPLTMGRTTEDQWDTGVFGPGFNDDPKLDPYDPFSSEVAAYREGDVMTLHPSLMSDSASHSAALFGMTSASSLKRNGETIATNEWHWDTESVPADDAAYEFSTWASWPADVDTVSSSVNATWKFRSSHAGAKQYLPLSAVRFRPHLDGTNTAPAGRLFAVPFTVAHQPHSTAGATTSFTLQVSFDDGRTWARAIYARSGDHGTAMIRNPAGHGFVSLKASAKDAAGNEVDQTITRAYRY